MFVFVRRAVAVTCLATALAVPFSVGCGAAVATHSGYKSDKAKPWKKPKVVALDEKFSAKVDGDLAYAEFDRARWLAVDLPAEGELSIKVEAAPSPPADDDDFDLAFEVYDPDERVITTADLDGDDAHELTKERTLIELKPGRYLIHVYLQRRTDRAEYEFKLQFTPGAGSGGDGMIASVAFPPRLPMVPSDDDTPAGSRPRPTKPTRPTRPSGHSRPDKPPATTVVAPPSTGGPVTARVINVNVVSGGTQITINRGTDNGLAPGMSGAVSGIKQGSFSLASCTPRSCKALVKATSDEVNRSGKAVVHP